MLRVLIYLIVLMLPDIASAATAQPASPEFWDGPGAPLKNLAYLALVRLFGGSFVGIIKGGKFVEWFNLICYLIGFGIVIQLAREVWKNCFAPLG